MATMTERTAMHRVPRGWRCRLKPDHDGPCPAWPAWWNLPEWFRYWKSVR